MCNTHTGEDESARYVEITWPTYQYLCVGTERTLFDFENMEPECGLLRFVQNKNLISPLVHRLIISYFIKMGNFIL
jgi:hypothetical protein